MKSVNHSVCIYLFVLTYFVLTYFVPKMIVKIGKRPGRIHCKKRCDISVFNGTMAHGACLSRSLDRYFILISKNQRIYQVIFDSSNHQCGIRVSYDMILFNCSGTFSPTLLHCYCKASHVNIGYS